MATLVDDAYVMALQSAWFWHSARVSNQANTVHELSRILCNAFGFVCRDQSVF
jgi:hypothetical protein